MLYTRYMGFPGSSAGKESTYNAGDPSSIPVSGRSSGEGTGYPLQYFWASLVAQLVKHLPAVQETWVGSLGWEDPLQKGKATHSSILVWRIAWSIQSMGSQRVRCDWATFIFTFFHFHEWKLKKLTTTNYCLRWTTYEASDKAKGQRLKASIIIAG